MGALALTLCDGDTPVLVDPAFGDAAARWVAFHTGAPLEERRGAARFAFLAVPDLAGFTTGSDAYPDRSATVIAAARLSGAAWQLEGPGIAGTRTVRLDMPDGLCERLAENRALFPRGVDLVLCEGSAIAGLPRTTRVRPAHEGRTDDP
jgi:alpha-D-ribose 1-methylphosphonate 5-triphosphate synthase subunit PhnH